MLPVDKYRHQIIQFCHAWSVAEISIFGSAIREDFCAESDVDVLVSFQNNVTWSLFDLVAMQQELGNIFGRQVDLVEKEALRNPFRRHAILKDREVLYAA